MTTNSNYELSPADDIDFNEDDSANDYDNNIADFDLSTSPPESKNPKRNNKRNYLAQKKIELLKEERRLRKLVEDDYDDWD
jgi:hypothetical protein